MRKTTSLHYYSSTLFLLLLLVLTETVTSSNKKQKDEQHQEEGPDINLTVVDIRNDLPPNWPKLYLVGSFQLGEAQIYPGKSYNFLAGGKSESGILIMENDRCAPFQAFDTKVELGRHNVFWSVRSDGAYHSWDRSNWEKKASWLPRELCV